MRKGLFFTLVVMLLFCGCAAPVKINRFDPVADRPDLKTFIRDNETYLSFEDKHYRVTAALFEYNSVVVLPLEITNKTGADIEPQEYSVSLHDGRDLKLIKMLKRGDLIAVRGKIEGKSYGKGLEGMAIDATVNALMDAANVNTQKTMIKGLDHAINDYFSFRPVYAHETRQGLLCFLVDFRLEYPLTLILKIRQERIPLRFLPQKTS
jgi:hypothetical protein